MLTKQSILMHHQPTLSRSTKGAVFEEDMDEPGVVRRFVMYIGDWKDMGSPKVITVSVEPGDELNPK